MANCKIKISPGSANLNILHCSAPNPTQSQHLRANPHDDLCGICNKIVKDDQKAFICDQCDNWIHIQCSNISVLQYEHYQINHEQELRCKKCRSCGVCDKVIATNHKHLECYLCTKSIHIRCNKFDEKTFKRFKENKEHIFYCIKCMDENIPFQNLTEKELKMTLDGIHIPDDIIIETVFLNRAQTHLTDKINEIIQNFSASDENDKSETDDIKPIDCKYLSIEEFQKEKFNSKKEFSILHLNIHSVEAHIAELNIILNLINYQFDFICISESKVRKNCEPQVDIIIPGYQYPVGTPTESTKGGVLIYVSNGINFKPREDLTIFKEKELESYFIEVIHERSTNSIVGCVYRHPCMDEHIFIEEYMQPLNEKLETESKKVFIAGDFNYNLLNLEHEATANFFEEMMSNYLMPTIILPTKINSKNDTVIDNIFTNQVNPEMKSGNLTVSISDHLPSFLIFPNDNQNHLPKKQNIYVRNLEILTE